jgi:RHS repeat-associated protein
MNHRTGAAALIAEFQYGYDRMGHRLFEKRVHDGNLGDAYSYDSVYRLIRDSQAVDLSGVAPGTEIDPTVPPYSNAPNQLQYSYDGVGNRTTGTQVVSNVPTVTTYAQVVDGAVKDAEVNQYTTTQEDSLPIKNYTYDNNGNLTSDGTRKYAYDFKNRLVEVRNQSSDALIAQYSYDAFDRRSMKMLAGGPATEFLYDGIEIVEERDSTNAITRQYVWGNDIDELLQEKTATATYYSHENSIGSIAALTNPSGSVVERYRYDPFGNTTLPVDGATGNRIRFHGAYFDDETDFYFMRHRTYSPALGRFLQRDPIGIWTDAMNLGNGYSLAGSDAVNRKDPSGLQGTTDAERQDIAGDIDKLGTEDLQEREEAQGRLEKAARESEQKRQEIEKQLREKLEKSTDEEIRSRATDILNNLETWKKRRDRQRKIVELMKEIDSLWAWLKSRGYKNSLLFEKGWDIEGLEFVRDRLNALIKEYLEQQRRYPYCVGSGKEGAKKPPKWTPPDK